MNDDAQSGDDVLSGLPRTRPTHTSAKRAAARAKAAKGTAPARAAKAKPREEPKPEPEPQVAAVSADPEPIPETREDGTPTGAEIVATAVQAAGELVDLGGKALKGILGRLPKL